MPCQVVAGRREGIPDQQNPPLAKCRRKKHHEPQSERACTETWWRRDIETDATSLQGNAKREGCGGLHLCGPCSANRVIGIAQDETPLGAGLSGGPQPQLPMKRPPWCQAERIHRHGRAFHDYHNNTWKVLHWAGHEPLKRHKDAKRADPVDPCSRQELLACQIGADDEPVCTTARRSPLRAGQLTTAGTHRSIERNSTMNHISWQLDDKPGLQDNMQVLPLNAIQVRDLSGWRTAKFRWGQQDSEIRPRALNMGCTNSVNCRGKRPVIIRAGMPQAYATGRD